MTVSPAKHTANDAPSFMNSRRPVHWASGLLIVLGGILLLGSGAYFAYGLYAQSQKDALNQPFDDFVYTPQSQEPGYNPDEKARVGVLDSLRATILRIKIPSIAVDSKVTALGTIVNDKGELVWDTPKNTVGHHEGTAFPGDFGNVVLSGHISSPVRNEGNVFADLPKVEEGETVLLETLTGTYVYRIIGRQVVEPTQIEVMAPTSYPAVTLITCFPDFIYTHRLIIRGALESFTPWDNQIEGS